MLIPLRDGGPFWTLIRDGVVFHHPTAMTQGGGERPPPYLEGSAVSRRIAVAVDSAIKAWAPAHGTQKLAHSANSPLDPSVVDMTHRPARDKRIASSISTRPSSSCMMNVARGKSASRPVLKIEGCWGPILGPIGRGDPRSLFWLYA